MKQKAFTLIELLVVIAVIGVIASIVLVNLRGTREKAQVARGLSFSQSIYHTLGAYAVAIYRFETITEPPAPVETPDASGYENDLLSIILMMPGSPYPLSCEGIINNALLYDGTSYFGIKSPPTGNFDFSQTNEITIEVWIKITEAPPMDVEIINIADVFPLVHFAYRIKVTTDLHPLYHPGDSSVDQVITDFTFKLDRWYHVVMTVRGGDKAEIYINGKSVHKSSDGVPAILPDGVYSEIGPIFIGVIDEVRIYDQAFNL